MISHAELLELLNYDPETGIFTWKRDVGKRFKAGDVAGCPNNNDNKNARRRIKVDGRLYCTNVLAWYWMTGSMPTSIVDHRNRNSLDDRWENLRLATGSQNNHNSELHRNNKSGVKGVCWDKERQKWMAYIWINGKLKIIDRFDENNFAGAVEAATFAREFFFGEFYADLSKKDNERSTIICPRMEWISGRGPYSRGAMWPKQR